MHLQENRVGILGKLAWVSPLIAYLHIGFLKSTLVKPNLKPKHYQLHAHVLLRRDYTPSAQWMSVRTSPNARAEKRRWATRYPAAASIGPVIVGLHSLPQAGEIRDMKHLCCHSRIMLGNLWLHCKVAPTVTCAVYWLTSTGSCTKLNR